MSKTEAREIILKVQNNTATPAERLLVKLALSVLTKDILKTPGV